MVRFALLSEDRELQRRLTGALGRDFDVLLDHNETRILQLLDSGACDACILHLSSGSDPSSKRVEFARRLIESKVDLFIAADEGFEWTAVEMVHLGAKGYFRNDGIFRDLKTRLLRGFLGTKTQEVGVSQVYDCKRWDGLVGSGPSIQEVSNLIRLVADIAVPVFVSGESGTGKELIARAIHNMGARASEPFVAVSCGAIPETLLEAELFGHEKGAFTGTTGARQGHFEEAGAGTLFLDEIGDLSMPAQIKLLRVLQQREFRRLGSNRLIPLQARLVFATHQDLDELVAQGTFRQDLYYRINVIRINSPALRNRPEDIPDLVDHFLQMYSQIYDLPVPEIDPQAFSMLQNYAWPGNVRELEHVIQSTLILSRGGAIHAESLPAHIRGGNTASEANIVDIANYMTEGSFEQQLNNYKVKVAMAAVRQCRGNKTLAARSLNISRAYLHRLLRLGGDEQFGDVEVEAV